MDEFVTELTASQLASASLIDPRLQEPSTRVKIYRAIHPDPLPHHAVLLRKLLALEIEYRRTNPASHNDFDDFFENLYWCGFLLFRIGDLDDVLPMWAAKNINMDTGCGFDIQCLVGAGVDTTIDYLQQHHSPEARAALEYILECRHVGDFEEIGEWVQGRISYFAG